MSSLPLNIKDNKIPTYGTISLYVIQPIIGILILGFSASLSADNTGTALIAAVFGLSILAFIASIVLIVFLVIWTLNAQNNAEEIHEDQDSKLIPWPAWATAVFGIFPITNITLFPYAMYKIIKATKASQVALFALYGYISLGFVALIKAGYDLATFFSNFDIEVEPETNFTSASIDMVLQVIIVLCTILFIYYIYKAQQKIAES